MYEAQTITTKPTAPPYPGMRWIYHRLTRTKEYMFDFKVHTFAPGEYKQMPEPEAIWMAEHNKAIEYPAREEHPDPKVRAEAIQYAFALDDDPHYGVPLELTADEEREYLSREGMPMYLQRGTDVKTRPRLIRVGEVPGVEPERLNSAAPAASPEVLSLAKEMAAQMFEEFQQKQRRILGRPTRRRARPSPPVPAAPAQPGPDPAA